VTNTQDRESQGAYLKTLAPPAVDQGTLAWSLSRAAWQGSAATKPTCRSWVEGTMKTSVSSNFHSKILEEKLIPSALDKMGNTECRWMRTAKP
jgi:hypothetical protein